MSGTGIWSWWALFALGAFHGINPGMGWLFAVALGMQEQRRGAVERSLEVLLGPDLRELPGQRARHGRRG